MKGRRRQDPNWRSAWIEPQRCQSLTKGRGIRVKNTFKRIVRVSCLGQAGQPCSSGSICATSCGSATDWAPIHSGSHKIAFYHHLRCSRCKKVTFCSIRLRSFFAFPSNLKLLRRDLTQFRRKESKEFGSFCTMFVPYLGCAIIKQITLQPIPLALEFDFDIILYILKRRRSTNFGSRGPERIEMNDDALPRHVRVPHLDRCSLTIELYAAIYLKLLKIKLRIQPCQAQGWSVPNERWSRTLLHATKIAESNTK